MQRAAELGQINAAKDNLAYAPLATPPEQGFSDAHTILFPNTPKSDRKVLGGDEALVVHLVNDGRVILVVRTAIRRPKDTRRHIHCISSQTKLHVIECRRSVNPSCIIEWIWVFQSRSDTLSVSISPIITKDESQRSRFPTHLRTVRCRCST